MGWNLLEDNITFEQSCKLTVLLRVLTMCTIIVERLNFCICIITVNIVRRTFLIEIDGRFKAAMVECE